MCKHIQIVRIVSDSMLLQGCGLVLRIGHGLAHMFRTICPPLAIGILTFQLDYIAPVVFSIVRKYGIDQEDGYGLN
jgi:hypothetical protein